MALSSRACLKLTFWLITCSVERRVGRPNRHGAHSSGNTEGSWLSGSPASAPRAASCRVATPDIVCCMPVCVQVATITVAEYVQQFFGKYAQKGYGMEPAENAKGAAQNFVGAS